MLDPAKDESRKFRPILARGGFIFTCYKSLEASTYMYMVFLIKTKFTTIRRWLINHLFHASLVLVMGQHVILRNLTLISNVSGFKEHGLLRGHKKD